MNSSLNELINALCDDPHPVPSMIRSAMELAYKLGVSDGAIEACDKMIGGINEATAIEKG